jgi:nicotinamide phosphoribosyltransferase
MKIFPPHAVDFYKTGHIKMYPDKTESVYSNFTARSDRLAKMLPDFDHKVVNFGLQGVIKWMIIDVWNRDFFQRPKEEVLKKYKRRMDKSLGQGAVGTDHIEALHDLGYLPLHIKALPEASRVNIQVPLFTVINTHPAFGWLTNYMEDILSAECWKSITVATLAYEYRRLLERYASLTGSPQEFVAWQGHDFSMRGMSGIHDAAKSGAAHLLSFTGTDTVPAIDYLEDYYGAADEFVGGSIPATEHSVMCMGGFDGEFETFRRLIEKLYPSGKISIVSDTWDFWRVITEYAADLRDVIEGRKPDDLGAPKVVFRPDSGDPVEILCGSADVMDLDATTLDYARTLALDILEGRVREETPHGEPGECEPEGYFRFDGQIFLAKAQIEWNRHDKAYYYVDGASLTSFEPVELAPDQKGAVECLWETFGGTLTSTGHKLLNPVVGLIYGDAITLDRAQRILERLHKKGFASGNIVFGIGSYSYQFVTRDTFGHAYKATWGVVDGVPRELFKDPITAKGAKRSAKGLLRVEKVGDDFVLYDQQPTDEGGELRTVFLDGVLHNEEKLSVLRTRLLG